MTKPRLMKMIQIELLRLDNPILTEELARRLDESSERLHALARHEKQAFRSLHVAVWRHLSDGEFYWEYA